MTFASARQIAARLNIDVGQDTEFRNLRMEVALNTWLCDNGKLNIKAANIEWPRGGGGRGMMFASQFRPAPSRDLVEEETDIKVKNWLEEQGGTDLKWVTFVDEAQITLGGIQPQRCDIKWKEEEYLSPKDFLEVLSRSSRRVVIPRGGMY